MIEIYVGLHVTYPLFLSDLMTLKFFRRMFEKYIKFHENPPTGKRFVPCGQTDGQT